MQFQLMGVAQHVCVVFSLNSLYIVMGNKATP